MEKRTIIQWFEWYLPEDGSWWKNCEQKAKEIKEAGFDTVWLPPAYKGAAGASDVGYGVYDWYDLGEFNQKGSIRTKYGTKEEYLQAVKSLQNAGLQVLADIVMNHKMGADEKESVEAREDQRNNREQAVTGEEKIEAWTKFTFPGRGGKYSSFQWDWTCFDGVDWDDATRKNSIYQFQGKDWDPEVDGENGNYDYLMGADLDLTSPKVREECKNWGRWYADTVGMDGFRLDAVKHMEADFFPEWLQIVNPTGSKFIVGEYWSPDMNAISHFLQESRNSMRLFDVPFHYHLYQASSSNGTYDMRNLWKGTLSEAKEELAVTFVDNHDTQPGQALESFVQGWFKPAAYALILLGSKGCPCVFYGDYAGIPHNFLPAVSELPLLLTLRKSAAWGEEKDYLDHPDLIGFLRLGDLEHPNSGVAVVITNGAGGSKHMEMGERFAGAMMMDRLGRIREPIQLDEKGAGDFPVPDGGVTVWTREEE